MKLRIGISLFIKCLILTTIFITTMNKSQAQRPGYGVSNWTQAADRDWNKKYWESRAKSNSGSSSIGSSSYSSSGSTYKPIIYESRRARRLREEKEAKQRLEKELRKFYTPTESALSIETRKREQEALIRRMERTRKINGLEYHLERAPLSIVHKGVQVGEVVQYKSRFGLLKEEQLIQPFMYDMITDISAGMILVKRDGKYGYLDSTGALAVPVMYDEAKLFQLNGLARVSKNGKWGFINKKNEEQVMIIYDSVSLFTHYVYFANSFTVAAKMKYNNKWGFVNEKGFEGIPPLWDSIGDYNYQGRAWVKNDGKYGIINLSGFEVTPTKWDSIGKFQSSKKLLAMVRYGNKIGFINLNGKEVIPAKWDQVYAFDSLDYAPVKAGTKVGFITADGLEIIPAKYDYITDFNQMGLSRVRLNKKWGMLDRKGNEFIPIRYDSLGMWENNRIWVKLDGNYGIFDNTGKVLLEAEYDYIGPFFQGYSRVRSNGKYGLVNDGYEIVLAAEYHEIYPGLYYLYAKKDGKYKVLNRKKNVWLPTEFEDLKMDFSSVEISAKQKGEWVVIADDVIKMP